MWERRGEKNLTVAATSSSTLDAEGGPLTGLPHGADGFAAQMGSQCLAQPHCCRALALSQGCRRDSSHHHCTPHAIIVRQRQLLHTMRFGSTAEVLAECRLKYYRVSACCIAS